MWYKFGDLSGGHWYPSIIELPPRIGGSKGTCGLVIGGLMKVTPSIPTDHADLACLQDKLVFGASVYKIADTPSLAASLRINFPISYLLPVGDVPAAPQLVIFGDSDGNVASLAIDFKTYSFKLTTVKYATPPHPALSPPLPVSTPSLPGHGL